MMNKNLKQGVASFQHIKKYYSTTIERVPSSKEVISLYRNLLKTSRNFNNYNFQQYGIRRTKDAFRANKDLKDEQEIIKNYNKGLHDLDVAKRQSLVSSLFGAGKLVIEK